MTSKNHTLGDILKVLSRKVSSKEFLLPVRRGYILVDALQQNVDLSLEAGYSLPVLQIQLRDKDKLIQTLLLHHALLRSKAVLDQLMDGLTACGVLHAMREHTTLFQPYFVANPQKQLTAGIYAHQYNGMACIYTLNI